MDRVAPFVRRLLLLGVGALAALASAGSARGQLLLAVDVRTDYVPGIDFTAVSLEACEVARPRRCQTAEVPAFVPELRDYLAGARVADLRVPGSGDYRIRAMLLNSGGNFMSERTLLVSMRGSRVLTVLFVKPATEATKKGELQEDRDGDGEVSAGDVLRYEIRVREATRFVDEPGPGGRLIPGSVATTHGIVTSGNDAGDSRVVVEGLSQADRREDVTITFDVEVVPAISNQGRAFLDAIDTVTRQRFGALAIAPTDDPATIALGDPTVTPVACSFSDCAGRLEVCQEKLEAAEDRLDRMLDDSDGDGVPAVLDLCGKTEAGAEVDGRGCSQRQFCGRVDAGKVDGDEICRRADWRDDEPLATHPEDCRPKEGLCLVAE